MNLLEDTLMLKLIYQIMLKKTDLKNSTGIDRSKLAPKSDLLNLKTELN